MRERLRQERRAGREIGLASHLVKATAQLIAEQRHLNRHHFTGQSQFKLTPLVKRRWEDVAARLLP